MSDDFKTVQCGTIVHNKKWAIEAYLDGILMQNYPKDKTSLAFFVNDSVDGTKEILVEKLSKIKELNEYRRIKVIEQNWGFQDKRNHRWFDKSIYKDQNAFREIANFSHFAKLRNQWLGMREDEDYYFSIDSDVILVQRNTLSRLVSLNLDIVAAPVNNGINRADGYDPADEVIASLLNDFGEENKEFILQLQRNKVPVRFGPEAVYNFARLYGYDLHRFELKPTVFEVDITGACILFSHKVVEAGVSYGPNIFGEDIYFCSLAKTLGFRVFVDGTIETEHWMDYNPHENPLSNTTMVELVKEA